MFGSQKAKKIKGMLAIVGLVSAGLFAVHCSDHSGPTGPSPDASASMKIRMGVSQVGVLGKTSAITLNKLVLSLTSSANDTIRDTITAGTTPSLNPVATAPQTVAKNYTLKPLRSWKVVVKTLDTRDSVIHKDSTTSPVLQAADTANVALTLSSKFSMYEAKFLSIPDSISSPAAGTSKQVLNINRLVLKIDGVAKVDSTVNPGPYFTPNATSTLAYDYVTVGSHSVELLAYGPMNYWDVANPLFSGSTIINVGAGSDSTVAVTLDWVGPTTGTGKLSVVIGKVGKITVNGTLPGAVIPN